MVRRCGRRWQIAMGLLSGITEARGERTPIAIVRQSVPAKEPQMATRIELAQQNGESEECGNRFRRRETRVATRIGGLPPKDSGSRCMRRSLHRAAIGACEKKQDGNSHWASSAKWRSLKWKRTPCATVRQSLLARRATNGNSRWTCS